MAKYEEWISEEGLLRIQGWARDGLTDEDIAANMGIVKSTLYEWKKKYPNLSNALKINKDVADRRVENALYEKALAGDTTAMIFWLKNRKPDAWRDKRELEHSGNIGISTALEDARKRALNAAE